MGSQINFFLGPQDLLMISKEIGSVGDPVFLHATSELAEPKEIENIIPVYGSEVLRILIARREDLPSIHLRPRQGHKDYIADTQNSLVIEFGRPYVSDHFIRAGRLYRDDKFWSAGGHSKPKPVDWVSWAKKLFEKCRRSLVGIDDSGYLSGKQAIELRETGVAFQQIDDPKNLRA